ncbi:MAG: deoxyribonuclease IV [Bacteroidetes bacterium]|nr:deoxyribonuclease IV [Bacteroidota bacterium]HET6245351.1 deoxyribonuclease IV [Bacteroidia bacterium]
MLLGVHCSIAGGYENAFLESKRLGINTFQIFTKNQRQWREREISETEGNLFRENLIKFGIVTAFSHTSYLINVASSNEIIRERSLFSLASEVKRCQQLGLAFTVLHPGSFKNSTLKEGIINIADALIAVLESTEQSNVKILLENTAGQGSSIGGRFEHLAEIIKHVGSPRIGICFDTCHAFASGYDIRKKEGFEITMDKLDKIVGINKLFAFHFNDSKGELASKLDRHEHIGKGKLGLEPFKEIMKWFPDIPKVLETPKENDMDKVNLRVLNELALSSINSF